jgi:hypothetical protein
MKTELEGRTKEFGVRLVRLIRTFPKTGDGIEMGRQLLPVLFPLSRFSLFAFSTL